VSFRTRKHASGRNAFKSADAARARVPPLKREAGGHAPYAPAARSCNWWPGGDRDAARSTGRAHEEHVVRTASASRRTSNIEDHNAREVGVGKPEKKTSVRAGQCATTTTSRAHPFRHPRERERSAVSRSRRTAPAATTTQAAMHHTGGKPRHHEDEAAGRDRGRTGRGMRLQPHPR
jgi:hypothetical protein